MTQHTSDLGWGQQCPWQDEGLACWEPSSWGWQQDLMARDLTGAVGAALGLQASPYGLLVPMPTPDRAQASPRGSSTSAAVRAAPSPWESSEKCKEQQLRKLSMLVNAS